MMDAATSSRRNGRLIAGGVGAAASAPAAPAITTLIAEFCRVAYGYNMPIEVQLALCAVVGSMLTGMVICARDIYSLLKQDQ